MASKLCCIAEEDERAGSPELPNVRLSRAVPAKQPLAPGETNSPTSHFTSDRSKDLYELRDIFHNARHLDDNRPAPVRPVRARFSRPSLHSIRSLHKVASIRSIIKKKLSRDFHKRKSSSSIQRTQTKDGSPRPPPDTVIKQQKRVSRKQIQITKEDLRNNLLSDKRPAEGGYDPDARVLDDVARNIGRKTPNKRPSIHSVDWVTTPGSKTTPESSTQSRTSADPERDLRPYNVYKTPAISLSNKFSQVFSTPNLRSGTSFNRGRKLRRSHSAEFRGLPKPPAFSPLHIPSLVDNNATSKAWSEATNESLRMSRFAVPLRNISTQAPQTDPSGDNDYEHERAHHQEGRNAPVIPDCASGMSAPSVNCSVKIRVQQPTSMAASGPSTSVPGTLREVSPSATVIRLERPQSEDDDDGSRYSVHLHSMRISHHLRSGSLLSWDKLANAPDLPNPTGAHGECDTNDSSGTSKHDQQRSRHDRQTSSSGIASCKIPARWGKVLPDDANVSPDSASSVYSTRPQSLPDSFRVSMVTLSRTGTENQCPSISSSTVRRPRRLASLPTDEEETPKPTQGCDRTTRVTSSSHSGGSLPHVPPTTSLARKNSVADTKVSKFREEFSPPAPKRKLTQSSSIIKFLNPKRLSVRSQSEASLRFETPIVSVDGPSDTLGVVADRQRRQSQSLMSLRAEQQSLGKNKGANPVWDRALQAHQAEKASLFLPKNKDLAVHASPFRERSGSVSTKRVSVDNPDLLTRAEGSSRRPSTANIQIPDEERGAAVSAPIFRRRAFAGSSDSEPGQELSNAYERQGDGREVVGAWGRYPSHTRGERAGSAGKADNVLPRDFALEAAINFASAKDDEDMVDPTQRRPSTPLLPGEKKKKKKLGGGRMIRSSSMTFGKAFMKNYGKMFKSQSTEFRRHGRGHRSSIASGGILEHPELELLPEVWSDSFSGHSNTGVMGSLDDPAAQNYPLRDIPKDKGRLVVGDSAATLHLRRNSSAPNLNEFSFNDGAAESECSHDGARIWSSYYKNCVDTYPPISADRNSIARDFDTFSGCASKNKQGFMHSFITRGTLEGHSRNTSQISHASEGNSCILRGGDDCAAEAKSVVSVRRSTMDLISEFQQQEASEHDKILTLGRGEGDEAMRGADGL